MKVSEFKCPNCGKLNPTWHVDPPRDDRTRRFYLCTSCRESYQTLDGYRRVAGEQIVSRKAGKLGERASDARHKLLGEVTCPACSSHARVVLTVRNNDGMFRTHKCRSCSKRFVSCERDGVLTMGGKMPSPPARTHQYP